MFGMKEKRSEAVEEVKMTTETEEAVEEVLEETVEEVKPYTFRKLGAPDMFLMFTIIKKIGLKEFKACFEGDGITNLIQGVMADDGEDTESSFISVGAGVFLELADTIIGNLPKCESEIYQLLANTSNLTVEEITADGNATMFVEMVIDFIKKEEFPDFIKVVSKLFK